MEINKEIVRLSQHDGRVEPILMLCDERFEDFNSVNFATAIHRLAKASDVDSSLSLDRRFQRMLKVVKDPKVLKQFASREFANVAWALVMLDIAEKDDLLQRLGAEITHRKFKEIAPQCISNLAWAYVKSEVRDVEGSFCLEKLLCCLGKVAMTRGLDDFRPQEVANLAWAYAKAGFFVKETLVVMIADQMIRRDLSTFQAQHLANIAWALTKLGTSNVSFGMKHIADEILERGLASFSATHIISLVMSYAKAAFVQSDRLMHCLSQETLLRGLQNLEERAFANLGWGFARYVTRELPDGTYPTFKADEFLQHMADELLRKSLKDFTSQHLATLGWAYAKLRCPGSEGRPRLRVPGAGELLVRIARAMRSRDLGSCSSQDICNLSWALVRADLLGDPDVQDLLESVREEVTKRASTLNSQDRHNLKFVFPGLLGSEPLPQQEQGPPSGPRDLGPPGAPQAGAAVSAWWWPSWHQLQATGFCPDHDAPWAAAVPELDGSAWADPVPEPEGSAWAEPCLLQLPAPAPVAAAAAAEAAAPACD